MGATALLVDEDVSAANFMARDGRMRALVMDESITPLLYRVNGLYDTHGVSSIVVVGGVGEWLDVPHRTVLLDKYIAKDASEKARSVSRQFSYGHVQYAGRGVVHRLVWDKEGTPAPRAPTAASLQPYQSKSNELDVSLMDGGQMFSIDITGTNDTQTEAASDDNANISGGRVIVDNGNGNSNDKDDDDDSGCVDLSRCEQLLGKKPQLLGCAWCVRYLLRTMTIEYDNDDKATNKAGNNRNEKQPASASPPTSITEALSRMEETIDRDGMEALWPERSHSEVVVRPRRHEVFMALTRLRGMRFRHLPLPPTEAELAAEREAEQRKAELAKLWSGRRSKNRFG